jgi:hypothetical protein
MIPQPRFLASVILITAGTLAAQPDPRFSCRERVSAFTHSVMANTSAERRGGLGNGDDMVLWKAKQPNGQLVTGFCEVIPSTGRVVRFGADQDSGEIKRTYKLTPGDAERICAREARATFSPGNGHLDAEFQTHISTKATYRVGWHYASMAGTIRSGSCEIDSATGHMRRFDANMTW